MSDNARTYPVPRVPVTPVLSAATLLGRRTPHICAITDLDEVRLVTSGRVALALAMRAIGIKAGERVLVPAYHSLSMIPPILASGAELAFYRIGTDASVDLDDVAARLDGARALVVVNYFGVPQDLVAIRAFCDRHSLAMVEDCAHSFFGACCGQPLGSFGDYAIGSSMKFLPIYEGGCLVSRTHSLAGLTLMAAGPGFELKAALATVERALAYGRLPLARLPLALKDRLWKLFRRRSGPAAAGAMTPSSSDSSYDFDPRWLDKRSALFSRLVLRFAARGRVARRRANYLALQEALRDVAGIPALFAALPADVYPWAFPVVAADPARIFAPLKEAGVPIIRFAETLWPGVDASVCQNSSALSRRVLAFPCHQELTQAELTWMIATIRRVLGGGR